MKPTKEPRDHKICPKCEKPYGFINCRVTADGKNFCLTCGEKEEKEKEPAVVEFAQRI